MVSTFSQRFKSLANQISEFLSRLSSSFKMADTQEGVCENGDVCGVLKISIYSACMIFRMQIDE